MALKYFGTDGIRGKVGTPQMDTRFMKKFAIAMARYLRMRHPKGEVHLVIGRDNRESGKEFEQILVENILPYGISIDLVGIAPTPAIAYWVDELEADNGIVLTASHNPATDNGIKLFNAHGIKQTLDKEKIIEPLIDDENVPPVPADYKMGELLKHKDVNSGYVDNIKILPKGALKGWKIVLDTANGATYKASPMALKRLGAEIVLIGNEPDGKNINEGCGSEHPQKMAAKVKEVGARVGFAHDGDGDRVIVADENGDIVHGDQLLGILALHAISKKALKGNKLVATVQSNFGLDQVIKKAGGEVIRSNVGDRNVFSKMKEHSASLGGESSGHIIFPHFTQTGDGLLSALKLLEVMLDTGKKLSELRKWVPLIPEAHKALRIRAKKKLDELPTLKAAELALKQKLGESGYVLIRFSGTEPKIRLLVQGPSQDIVNQGLETLIEAAKEDLDVLEGR